MAITVDKLLNIMKQKDFKKIVLGENSLTIAVGSSVSTVPLKDPSIIFGVDGLLRKAAADAQIDGKAIQNKASLDMAERQIVEQAPRFDDIPKEYLASSEPKKQPKPKPRPKNKVIQQVRGTSMSDVVTTRIDNFINDFFIDYYSNHSGQSVIEAFEAYKNGIKVDKHTVKNLSAQGLDAAIAKVARNLPKNISGSAKVLQAKVKSPDYVYDTSANITQNVLSDGVYNYLFTGKSLDRKTLNTIGTAVNDIFKDDKIIKVVGSDGSHTIIPKKTTLAIDGITEPKAALDMAKVVEKSALLAKDFTADSAKAVDQQFLETQAQLEKAAIAELQSLVENSTKGMVSSEIVSYLNSITVEQLKGFANNFCLETAYLKK
jgi:hypothetical protein